jgi:hypothetical protein
MQKNLMRTSSLNSSFLSYEKDIEIILRKLFVENKPYSDELKRLLVINTKDCLDNTENENYLTKLNNMSIAKLRKDGYIKLEPKIRLSEHEEVKSYIIITIDNFSTNGQNPQFRDCTVTFDVLCHTDYWDIGNYRIRPLKICGYIDGILDNTKLTGIGTFQFAGCQQMVLDENLSGYSLMYKAIHGSDDKIESEEE